MLWIVWRQHHILLNQVSGLSGAMVGWHFPLLLLAAFLPYATTVMGHFHDNPMAALLLWAVVWGLLLSRSVIQTMASRDHVQLADVDQAQYRESLVASWIVVGIGPSPWPWCGGRRGSRSSGLSRWLLAPSPGS